MQVLVEESQAAMHKDKKVEEETQQLQYMKQRQSDVLSTLVAISKLTSQMRGLKPALRAMIQAFGIDLKPEQRQVCLLLASPFWTSTKLNPFHGLLTDRIILSYQPPRLQRERWQSSRAQSQASYGQGRPFVLG